MSMQLFNNINIPSSVSPIFETADTYNLFGHDYLKSGFSPIPFAFNPINSASDHILTTESVYIKSIGTYGNKDIPVTKALVRKLANGNIRAYTTLKDTVITPSGIKVRDVSFSNDFPVEVLYTADDGGYDIIKTRAINADNTHRIYSCSNVDGSAQILCLAAQTYTDYTYIDQDSTKIYLLATMNNGIVNIVSIDKTTKVATLVTAPAAMTTGTKASTNIKLKVVNPLILTGGIKKYPIIYLNASSVTCLRMITYDPSKTGTIDNKITVDEYPIDVAMFVGVSDNSSYEIVCVDDTLVHVLHKSQGISGTTSGVASDKWGITTLVVDNTLKVATNKGLVLTTTAIPLHMMKFGSSMYVYSQFGYAKMDWDSVNKKWVKINEYVRNAVSYGLDSKGYMFYYLSTGDMYIDSPFFADKVEILDIPQIIVYSGTDVQVTARVCAYNMNGEKIEAPVDLVINQGDAVFSANGLKVISLTTSATGYLTVAITITGDSPLKITPKSSGVLS